MAPKLPGTNCITIAEDAVVELLANLETFQQFTGEPNAQGARERVYVHDLPKPFDPDREAWNRDEWAGFFPNAIVRHPADSEAFAFHQHARDVLHRFVPSFLRFQVTFESFADLNYDDQNQARVFLNRVGDVIEEITDTAGLRPGDFAANAISQVGQFHRRAYQRLEHLGDVFSLTISLERGVPEE